MLADHVEAELLGDFQVVLHRRVGGRGVEPVGPEALIERTPMEDRLVVEHHPGDAMLIFAEGDFAHGEVAGDCVAILPLVVDDDGKPIKKWRFRTPKFERRQLKLARTPCSDCLIPVKYLDAACLPAPCD